MNSVLAQAVLSGLMAGGVYAMVSMGLTLIFGIMRIINFAHGEFLMLGMYAAVGLSAALGLDPYVSIAINLCRHGDPRHRAGPSRRGGVQTTRRRSRAGSVQLPKK